MSLNDHRLFDDVAPYIRYAERIIDIGAGIRPQPFYKAKEHICIEPHDEYANWLESHGYSVLRGTALDVLPDVAPCEVVFMLDVIEHMEKEEGREVLRIARNKAKQVVVFTPHGFKPQSYVPGEKDAWGLNGGRWQTHRSGWTPEEFDGRIFSDGSSFFALLQS